MMKLLSVLTLKLNKRKTIRMLITKKEVALKSLVETAIECFNQAIRIDPNLTSAINDRMTAFCDLYKNYA